ncbi:MAG: hypothetical protein Q8881_02260, partial [Sweet potato little leaf phytoplasma]|nr:hypothetical protein [Sweet potato little leaf phytoplasma]
PTTTSIGGSGDWERTAAARLDGTTNEKLNGKEKKKEPREGRKPYRGLDVRGWNEKRWQQRNGATGRGN